MRLFLKYFARLGRFSKCVFIFLATCGCVLNLQGGGVEGGLERCCNRGRGADTKPHIFLQIFLKAKLLYKKGLSFRTYVTDIARFLKVRIDYFFVVVDLIPLRIA